MNEICFLSWECISDGSSSIVWEFLALWMSSWLLTSIITIAFDTSDTPTPAWIVVILSIAPTLIFSIAVGYTVAMFAGITAGDYTPGILALFGLSFGILVYIATKIRDRRR